MISPKLPSTAEIFEVGPRDGLQAEPRVLPVAARVTLVEKLMQAGLKDIEVGSFIKPGLIPQLDNSEAVVAQLVKAFPRGKRGARFWAFIPNEKGLERAAQAQVDGASFFVAASDTFCQKNVNTSREALLESLPSLLARGRKLGLKNRVYLSTLVYCPYEGDIAPAAVEKVVARVLDAGATEVALSDTTGHAHPGNLRAVLARLLKRWPAKSFALHLHDTRGLALTNVLVGLEHGIRRYDSSIAGTGGCPYAPGASGNLPTEDLANMLIKMKLLKNVDLERVGQAGFFMEQAFGKKMPSKMLRAMESAAARKAAS